jgi:energy-coupling factor transport system ATP-binding protein
MIRISGLSFKYESGREEALKNVDMTVCRGDFFGVIGSSGAGKTTLLHAINGIIPHHFRGDFYGSVEVNGSDTIDNRPEQLAGAVGSVRQDFESQMVSSVVEDEILFGLENFSVPRNEIEKRMTDALDKTGIRNLRERNIATLSGGQKQKVAISAIIALMPDILVLDEPTGELDPQSSRQIFLLLRELNEKHGITIVVVEQKIMLLCEFARKLAVMETGRIILQGEVADVLKKSREMEKAGVNCPRVVTLADRLREEKLYGGPIPVNIPEAEKMVRSITG